MRWLVVLPVLFFVGVVELVGEDVGGFGGEFVGQIWVAGGAEGF